MSISQKKESGIVSTKERILQEAITLFSIKGYDAVSVGQIAEAVGIKAPSLYKHYKSKQDIFQAILDEMQKRYKEQTTALQINGSDEKTDAEVFSSVSEEQLVKMGMQLFLYFLHDEYVSKFRRMLTIEQFHSEELSDLFNKQYVEDPYPISQSCLRCFVSQGHSGRRMQTLWHFISMHPYICYLRCATDSRHMKRKHCRN